MPARYRAWITRSSSVASRTDSRERAMSCSATRRLPSSRCDSARTKRLVSAEVAVATSAATFACVTDASRTNPLNSGNEVLTATIQPDRSAPVTRPSFDQL